MTWTPIVVTGASGFIGRHFTASLLSAGARVRALTRIAREPGTDGSGIEWVSGDLGDRGAWERLLEPGCTVVNLAYSQVSAEADAVAATRAMVAACDRARVARLVHCSTISVYGRTAGGVIDESTPCNPIDSYGRQKLAIEEAVRDSVAGRFENAILRPSAVFGAGGKALRTLCDSLVHRPWLANYSRSVLFGRRRMHLVPVETVVQTLGFLCSVPRAIDRETFIISDDDDPLNNFQDVERILMEGLRVRNYPVPRLPLPAGVLRRLLQLRGRSEIDPYCEYRDHKLRSWGFAKQTEFEAALRAFASAGLETGPRGASN